jgi:lipopolysaccharide assembly outer membrane protein LptD (OstA)
MKTALLSLCALITASAFGAPATAGDGILLSGKTIDHELVSVTGAATATFHDTQVTADAIRFDSGANTLVCDGTVTVKAKGTVITANAARIKLTDKPVQVYFLDAKSIKFEGKPRAGQEAP